MPYPVSYPRLLAEAHAFPIATEAAFRLRITTLSRDAPGVLDGGSTSALAAELEEHLRLRAGGLSLTQLRHLRDKVWFHAGDERAVVPRDQGPVRLHVSLSEQIGSLAAQCLEHHGHRVQIRGDGRLAERALEWRWLSFFLPADLFVAALAANEGVDPTHDAVRIVTPHLSELLREPCAETHLHAGASVPFSLLWTALTRDVADARVLKLKAEVGTPPFGSAAAFAAMLVTACTARALLASFLRRRDDVAAPATFDDFCREDLPELAARVQWGLGERTALSGLHAALRHLSNRGEPLEPGYARRLYASLIGVPRGITSAARSSGLADVIARDPLSGWLSRPGAPGGHVCPETRFAARALAYLKDAGRQDRRFAEIFWQYQRVRCLTHRFLVEEPGTAGLDWFTRHYARISPLRGALEKLTYATALEFQARDLHLAALEARTSPGSSWVEIRDEARSLARHAEDYEPSPSRQRPEVGLVLHFTKEWDRKLPRGKRRMHADPRQTAFGCRFGAWFERRMSQAKAIAGALDRHPELLLVLRGIDVANVELAVPTWPIVPLFRHVQRASVRASERLGRLRRVWDAGPLRVTVHAGEDYRRLVEGLRRIHEPIEFDITQVGDRIGHAVALGEEPARWAMAGRTTTQPAEERLDDLVWELARYQRGDIPADAGRLEMVRAEVVKLGWDIYREEASADDLLAARQIRHSPEALSRLGYPFIRQRTFEGVAPRLFYRYLMDVGVFERGQTPIRVDVREDEIAMLRAVQSWLRRELGRREMTVESNPSSNLMIADYLTLEDHGVFRMCPLTSEGPTDGERVLVSVNTDNPITFASSLADELAHLYFALLNRGAAADVALAWLSRARETGYRSRFTLRASSERAALRQLGPRR